MADYYERCETLFGDYPLAVNDIGPGTITLMTPRGRFYGLGRLRGGAYLIWRWNSDDSDADQRIEPGTTQISGELSEVLSRSVPLPRDGAMFGYRWHGDDANALLTFHQEQGPVPEYALLVRTDSKDSKDSKDHLPSFAGQPFGEWFWLDMKAGYIIDLAPAVSVTRRTVYWVPRVMLDDTGAIVVRTPVTLGRGHGSRILPAGIYAYWRAVRTATHLPLIVDEVLARSGARDLGPAFSPVDDATRA